jgi:hypothetical protein
MATRDVIESHCCLDNPVAKPETQPTLAYDRIQLPVISAHLRHADSAVVHAALVSLRRLLTTHDSSYKAHEAGLFDILSVKARLADEDSLPINRLALQAIRLTLESPGLRLATVTNPDVVEALKHCMHSSDMECRGQTYFSLSAAAEKHDSAVELLNASFMSEIVARISSETAALPSTDNVLSVVLAALRRLLSHTGTVAAEKALESEAVTALFAVLNSPSATNATLAGAAEAIMQVAFESAGKVACIAVPDSVRTLLTLARHADRHLVAPAIGCLMVRITIIAFCAGVLSK